MAVPASNRHTGRKQKHHAPRHPAQFLPSAAIASGIKIRHHAAYGFIFLFLLFSSFKILIGEENSRQDQIIYYNPETNKINIADPVTDIRALTGLSDEERKKQIKEILANKNFERDLREYFDEFGPITEYDDSEYEKDMKSSPKPRRKDLIDREEIEANPDLTDIEKKSEAIQALTRLDQVKNVADGPSLLACQTLYKKGISTYCTNHVLETGYTSINIPYNSLSNENKEILQDLIKRNPDNYYIHKMTGFYSDLDGENAEISGNKPMELVLGFIEIPTIVPYF